MPHDKDNNDDDDDDEDDDDDDDRAGEWDEQQGLRLPQSTLPSKIQGDYDDDDDASMHQ